MYNIDQAYLFPNRKKKQKTLPSKFLKSIAASHNSEIPRHADLGPVSRFPITARASRAQQDSL